MGFVLLLLAFTAFVALFCGAWRLYGFQTKCAAGQVDAHGRVVGPGEVTAIAWDRLVRIEIITTDQGPFQEDLFWFFVAADGSACSVPGGAIDGGVMERVSALPGVHYEAIIQAMGSCEDARFLVWSRAESAGPKPAEPSLEQAASEADLHARRAALGFAVVHGFDVVAVGI